MGMMANIVCKTAGIAGMSAVLYDAYSVGKLNSRRVSEDMEADHYLKIHADTRNLTNESEVDKAIQKRVKDFIQFLKKDYQGKTIGIVAHRAPQLAFEVLTKNISWEEANKTDWRKTKAWQPGWEYIIE